MFIECSKGCSDGVCDVSAMEVMPSEEYSCKGCLIEDKCYLFGYRKSNNFCSDTGSFVEQLEGDKVCENNFECSSNVCVSSQCVSEGLLQKFFNWFRRLFGEN